MDDSLGVNDAFFQSSFKWESAEEVKWAQIIPQVCLEIEHDTNEK